MGHTNVNGNPLKFSLELDDEGNYIVEMQGTAMDIGHQLFLPFFENMKMQGKAVAAGICAAMKLAYPKESKRIFITKIKKNGTSHGTTEV